MMYYTCKKLSSEEEVLVVWFTVSLGKTREERDEGG